MKIEFTKDQVNNMIQFVDIAVRQAGLQAAGPALEIAILLQRALEAEGAVDTSKVEKVVAEEVN